MRPVHIAVCVAAAVLVPRPAAAGGSSIVLESYQGDRPPDAELLLKPVYAELGKHGFVLGDKLVTVLGQTVSRGSGQLTASQSVEAQKHVEDGYQRFIDGDYPKAIAAEHQALALYATAPGQMAKENALRDLQFKALLVAARSSEVLGKGEDAFGYMAEAIRTFPGRHVSAAEFDPKVNALYRKVKEELHRQGEGTLEVKVDDPNAVIFVDERFVGTGAIKLENLVPGRYRVYVAKGGQAGRVREVEVAAGGHATIDVPWQIDGTLRTHAGYAGLELGRGAGTAEEIGVAVKVARAVGAKNVVVLGLRTLDGRRAVVGYSVSTESQNKVFAAVQIEPVDPAPGTLAKLAALLAGDKNVETKGIITKEPTPAPVQVAGTRHGAMHTLKWVFLAGGVVGLAAGGGLYATAQEQPTGDGTRMAGYRDTKTLGLGVGAAGVVLTGVAIYMFAADHDVPVESSGPHGVAIVPAIGPRGAGLTVLGRF
jgi:hypothetical protein